MKLITTIAAAAIAATLSYSSAEAQPREDGTAAWSEGIMTRVGHSLTGPSLLVRRNVPTGAVEIAFRTDTDGTIADAHVLNSSGSSRLDRYARRAVETLGTLDAPKGADAGNRQFLARIVVLDQGPRTAARAADMVALAANENGWLGDAELADSNPGLIRLAVAD